MKLTINKKWKWLAKEPNGVWYFHTDKPRRQIELPGRGWRAIRYLCSLSDTVTAEPESNYDWKYSLYHRVGENEWVQEANHANDK